jgi:hypothetical protein
MCIYPGHRIGQKPFAVRLLLLTPFHLGRFNHACVAINGLRMFCPIVLSVLLLTVAPNLALFVR